MAAPDVTSGASAFEAKIRDPRRLEGWLSELRRPLVFTNGVFDLLHRRRGGVAEIADRLCQRRDQGELIEGTQFKVRAGRSPASDGSVPGSLSSMSQSLFFTAA